MWYLYLDESGDLGFDFVNKKPSKFFTIAILVVHGVSNNRRLISAVHTTIQRKLNPRNRRRRLVTELKGAATTLAIKKYFYQRAVGTEFGIYSLTLNKRRVFERLTREKARVYNYVARQVLDHIPLEKNGAGRVELVIDRSKSKPEIQEFNSYIRRHLEAKLSPTVPLVISHRKSDDVPGLQVADMFAWGVFQKYERSNTEWFEVFKEKVKFDEQFL